MHHFSANAIIQSTRSIFLRLKFIWPLLYLAAVTALIAPALSHWSYDDPFITYRYAVNLARGHGFVYNLGEQVLSTTTPLFTIILSGLFKLGLKPHPAAITIGSLSLAAGALFFWQLAHFWGSPLVGWTGLLLYPAFPMLLNTLGSETPLYLALCLGSFAAYARERYSLTALSASLACLARPDGFLIPILLAAHFLLSRKPAVPWKSIGIFTGITLSWILFAWIYFGSPVPATYFAKYSQGTMSISQKFLPGFLALLDTNIRTWSWQIRSLLAIIGVIGLVKLDKRWSLFLAWTVLYFLSYAALGVTSYFWYYAPLAPGLLVCIGSGVEATSRILHAKKQIPGWLPGLAVIGILGVLVTANGYNFQLLRQESNPRYEIYHAAGLWLKKHTPQSASIGTLEVGIIGFMSDRSMIDFSGLLQPEIALQLNSADSFERGALYALSAYHPDFLVLHDKLYPRLESELPGFNCELIHKLKGKKFGYDNNLMIYDCR